MSGIRLKYQLWCSSLSCLQPLFHYSQRSPHLFRTALLSTSAKTWLRSSSPPLHWLLVFCCSQWQWSCLAGSPGTSCWFSSWARAYLLSSLLALHDGGPSSLTYVNMDAVNISLFPKSKRKTDGRDYSDGLLVAGYEEQSELYYWVNYDLLRLVFPVDWLLLCLMIMSGHNECQWQEESWLMWVMTWLTVV